MLTVSLFRQPSIVVDRSSRSSVIAMGSCISRSSSGKGQRLGSSAEATVGTQADIVPNQPDREHRAAAAEARLQREQHRGMGDGHLSRKLAEEQRSGGTGNRAPEMPERLDVRTLKRQRRATGCVWMTI